MQAAAGNSNVDAVNNSPARVASVITVGATNINDARWAFSNFGAVVDIFAPGQHIYSAWIGSNTDVAILNGTSQAAGYIAGLVATIISGRGQLTPAAMSERLNDIALPNLLVNIRTSLSNFVPNAL
ncbi:hypothetical protein C0991_012408 [Blastosporella zonata]|nr:hypothetical protein C0991_012408 [Blastosporella zonata]